MLPVPILLLILVIGLFVLIYGFIVKKILYLVVASILILLFVSQSSELIKYITYLLL